MVTSVSMTSELVLTTVLECPGLGDSLIQVLTAAGRGSLPSPCTELTPWGTMSMLQVCLFACPQLTCVHAAI